MFRGLDHLRIPDHSILAVTNARGLYVCRVDPSLHDLDGMCSLGLSSKQLRIT